ncbi:MAG: hypothetical protein FD188_3231 [Ignavibacteria bacterium]|nr:MAG: hypothetical protein FD188_3231 [Ignavibacteria bacterium]
MERPFHLHAATAKNVKILYRISGPNNSCIRTVNGDQVANYRGLWHWRRQDFCSGGHLATKRLPRDFGGEIGAELRSGGTKWSQCFSQKVN